MDADVNHLVRNEVNGFAIIAPVFSAKERLGLIL